MLNIGVIGATGVVGRTTLKLLEEKGLCQNNLFFFASEKNNGTILSCGEKEYVVKTLNECNLKKSKLDYALFCVGDSVSSRFVPMLVKEGVKVIDFSSFYRKEFPLIVPQINMEKAKGNLICNPNCSTIAGVMALYRVHQMWGLKRIVYSTYQAVSGAGKLALEDLENQGGVPLKKFDFPIRNNIIPYIGKIFEDRYCQEEKKLIFETKKILDDLDIKISATTVRVPVDIGHSLSINFEVEKSASLEDVKDAILSASGVIFMGNECPPMPMFSRHQDKVLVGRLRRDECNDKTFSIFVSSDNLRKGAAQNGIEILERMIADDSM